MSALNSLVSESIDIVVHCARNRDQVRVNEVVAVEDLQTGPDSTAFTITEIFRRERPDAPLSWTGNLPSRATRALEMAGYDVRRLLDPELAPFGVGTPLRPPVDVRADEDPASARPVPRRRAATVRSRRGTSA